MIQDYSGFETILLANLGIKWMVFLFTLILLFLYWMIIAWSALSRGKTSFISPFLNKFYNLNIHNKEFKCFTLIIWDWSSENSASCRLNLIRKRNTKIVPLVIVRSADIIWPWSWIIASFYFPPARGSCMIINIITYFTRKGNYQSPRHKLEGSNEGITEHVSVN